MAHKHYTDDNAPHAEILMPAVTRCAYGEAVGLPRAGNCDVD